MNHSFLIGRLTSAPEMRQTQSGVSVCTFSIAVNRRMNREITDYFNIVAWRGLAETCAKYLVKGQQVSVAGEIQTRSYDDKKGVKKYVTEIVAEDIEFLARPNGGQRESYEQPAKQKNEFANKMSAEAFDDVEVLDDDDLPF